jgi:hypothetical protein
MAPRHTMLKSAQKALREDHKLRHKNNPVDLKWNPLGP